MVGEKPAAQLPSGPGLHPRQGCRPREDRPGLGGRPLNEPVAAFPSFRTRAPRHAPKEGVGVTMREASGLRELVAPCGPVGVAYSLPGPWAPLLGRPRTSRGVVVS